MKSINTKLGISLFLFAFLLLVGTNDALAIKRVLIEQQTGAWCGWCPDGSVRMDQIIDQNPDRVIGVKWHNGDAMTITEQSQFAQTFGITGYPTGTVDRKPYNGRIALNRGDWAAAVNANLNSPNVADVSVQYDLDPTTKKITATVTGKALVNETRQLALNLYIIEDFCSGTGNQWDQRNYMSGNASFVGHPYYSKPDPVTNYQHMKVVRKVLGGVYGSTKNVPATLNNGQEFSETFTYNVEPSWNTDNLYVVGVIQAFVTSGQSLTDAQIINAIEVGRKEVLITEVNVAEPHKMIDPGQTMKRQIELQNPQDFQISVNLAISGTVPNGWELTFPSSVNIPAKGKVSVEATVVAPTGTPSFAEFKFTATPKKFAEYNSAPSAGGFTSLTSNTKFIYYTGSNGNSAAFTSTMNGMNEYIKDFAFVPFGADVIDAYKPAYFDVIFISSNLSGASGLFSGVSGASVATFNAVTQAINAGKKVVISSDYDLSYALSNNGTQQARDFYSFLGVEGGEYVFRRQFSNGQWGNQLFNFPVKGVNGDVISNGMSFTGNQYNQATNPYFVYLTDVLRVKAGSFGVPFLIMDDDQSRIGGIRFEKGESKYIYMSVGFEALVPADRAMLIDKIMKWFKTETAPDGPKVAVNTKTLDFGTVDTDQSKDMTITLSNTGDQALTVYSIVKTGDSKKAFTIVSGDNVKSVAAGESVDVLVKFEPKDADNYSGVITFTTDGKNEQTTSVNLSGRGNPAGSVAYGTTPNGALTMSMTPNPVVDNSQFNYTISSDESRNVRIYVMDLAGKVITELVNSSLSAGTYNMNFSATNYVSGTYFIMAEVDGSKAQIPVVITK